MEIDDLVNQFNHNTAIEWKPKYNFIRDIDIIIKELKLYFTYINLDIYEVLVSCGHDLTWNQEYNVSQTDLNWFKNQGLIHILTNINQINTIEEYNAVLQIHKQLIELFELQVE